MEAGPGLTPNSRRDAGQVAAGGAAGHLGSWGHGSGTLPQLYHMQLSPWTSRLVFLSDGNDTSPLEPLPKVPGTVSAS